MQRHTDREFSMCAGFLLCAVHWRKVTQTGSALHFCTTDASAQQYFTVQYFIVLSHCQWNWPLHLNFDKAGGSNDLPVRAARGAGVSFHSKPSGKPLFIWNPRETSRNPRETLFSIETLEKTRANWWGLGKLTKTFQIVTPCQIVCKLNTAQS